jgi:dCTP diphosphatase
MSQPPDDDQTRVSDLKAAVDAFNTARRWQRFHAPKNLAMAIAIEAAELMEPFQWRATSDEMPEALRAQVAEELADVLIYCLALANRLGLDISTIVRDKIAANHGKYPAPVPGDETG